MSAPRQVVRRLAEELRSIEETVRGREEQPIFSTGIAPLDRLLPDGGLRRGMLIEWLPAGDEDGGASIMALLTAKSSADGVRSAECGMRSEEASSQSEICHQKSEIVPPSAFQTLVLIDRHGTFYPPAAAAWGIPLANIILLRPTNPRDESWALDQALRSPAISAVLAWPHRLDGCAFRRLQLAAESSGTIGVLVRPASARKEPTWADVRLQVGPLCQSGPGRGQLAGSACPTGHFRFQTSSRRDFKLEIDSRRIPNPQHGWQLSIQRLHARSCTHQQDAVPIEITPEGQVREVAPTEHASTSTVRRA
jgi:hypothetical protein